MKDDNLIHVKFGYEEAFQSKKDILYLEMDLLKISKTIKNYHILRSDELELKLKFHKKIKEVNTNLRRLQTILPKLKIPEILKKDKDMEETSKLEEVTQKPKKSQEDETLEFQLQEIQKKLDSLQG